MATQSQNSKSDLMIEINVFYAIYNEYKKITR